MTYYDWTANRTRPRAPRGSFKTSPIFIGIVALFVGSGALAWFEKGSTGFDVFLFIVSGWLLVLCLHEFAHAFAAYRFGDVSVAQRGYLQLNPLKYAHWVLSLLIPLIFMLLGGIPLPGGAVYIEHSNIYSRRQDTTVSLVGPATNLMAAALLTVPFAVGMVGETHIIFWSGVAYLAVLQLIVGVINLLPIPGIDGGNAIYPYLSGDARRTFDQIRVFGFFILMLILLQPRISNPLWDHAFNLLQSAGIPHNAFFNGQTLFEFWKGSQPPAQF